MGTLLLFMLIPIALTQFYVVIRLLLGLLSWFFRLFTP